MRRIIILITILLFFPLSASPQSYPFRHYTVLDGLAQSQITGIMQDSRGFIWVGTRNGLSRFDGVEFVNYYVKDGLPSNYIVGMGEDKYGNLHILTKEGFSVYDGTGFLHYPAEDNSWEFIGLSDGVSYDPSFGFRGFIDNDSTYISFSFKDGKYEVKDRIAKSQLKNNFFPVLDNRDGRIIGQEEFVSVFSALFMKIGVGSVPQKSFRAGKNWFFIDEKGRMYRSEGMESVELIPFGESSLTAGRFYTLDYLPDNEIILYGDGIKSLFKWNHGHITNMYTDRDNTLWLGTELGLYRLMSPAFLNFTADDGLGENIWSVAEDLSGNIFLGSLAGTLQVYDGKRIKTIFKPDKRFGVSFYMGAKRLFNGDILLPTGEGVLMWNGSGLKPYIPARYQTEMVWQHPADSTIYIGTTEELVEIGYDNSIKRYPEFGHKNLGWVSDMDIDEDGRVWLITNKTVATLTKGSISIADSNLVKSHWYSIESAGGHIWVGGQAGLFFYDRERGFRPVLMPSDNKTVNSLAKINDTLLLAGRMNDLLLVDIPAFVRGDEIYWKIIDKTDGFIGHETEQNAIMKDRNGKFWISTTGGVVKFDPDQLIYSDCGPRVYISGYDIILRENDIEDIVKFNLYDNLPEELILSHRENSLRILLTCISTINPDKVCYRYRFSGDSEWSDPVYGNRIFLAALKPGKYTLEVIGAGINGVWNETPATLHIHVVPAFWQTTIFLILMAILVPLAGAAAGYTVMGRRARRKRESEALIERIKTLQIQNIARQFDPHFTFNIISSVGSMIMTDEKEKAYDTLLRFSEILRGMLNNPGMILKPLGEELALVNDYCTLQSHKMGEGRFRYKIEIRGGADVSFMFPRMVIISFVENAIKHGIMPRLSGGDVNISVSSEGDGLLVEIGDNGIGRVAAKQRNTPGTGSGTRLTDTIFDYLNEGKSEKLTYDIEDLTNERGEPEGTRVSVHIPSRFRIT